MADRKQGAGWSSGSSAAGHKANWSPICTIYSGVRGWIAVGQQRNCSQPT